ncbi:MAG: hypothetical protein IJT65_03715 [Eubacterium sp.]|nr:hypothetical protein [Eubacterium sp.]
MKLVKKNINIFVFALCFFALGFILFGAKSAFAGVVYPCNDESCTTDKYAIQSELDETGSVTLVNGKTYYLSGALHVESNMTINAGSATIICSGPILFNIPETAGYNAINNFTINGGIWRYDNLTGYKGSSIKLIHGRNIKFINMNIRHNNAKGHAIELIGCKDALIKNCNIAALGSDASKTEEAVQLDIATHTTAYFLEGEPFNTGIAKALQNGATCKNITIIGNTISGNRGVVANYTKKENKKYINKLHENIIIKNNKINSKRGEAVALFNTKSATVKGNTIICKAPGGDSYTVGLHIANFAKAKGLKKGKITVYKNKIKGGREALLVYSHTSSKFGKVVIKSNKLYCRKGKNKALKVYKNQTASLKNSKNKFYKWNGK